MSTFEDICVVAHLSDKADSTPRDIRLLRDYYGDICRMFKAKLFLVDQTGKADGYSEVVDSLASAMTHLTQYQPIFLSHRSDNDLGSFRHPVERTVYIVGPDHYSSIDPSDWKRTVRISRDMIWGHQALAIVLWDRVTKAGTWLSL